MAHITAITAREILDSRGDPTIEVTVRTDTGKTAWASVPSGASTGVHEAHELRDGDQRRYRGKGVLQAVSHVHTTIAGEIIGMDPTDQASIDARLCACDGTPNKKNLGANAILGVSLAVCRVGAMVSGKKLYQHIATLAHRDQKTLTLPVPMFNVINGGLHADSGLAVQEFMVVPRGIASFAEQVRAGSEIFHALEKRLQKDGFRTGVGNEGGFAPRLKRNTHALEMIRDAAQDCGYVPGKDVMLSMDVAASSFYDATQDFYMLQPEKETLRGADLVKLYTEWIDTYPILSIEDGLREDDWDGWHAMRAAIGNRVLLVGDDLLVTNVARLQKAIDTQACTAVLIKPNQIGTVTETLACMALADTHGMATIVSHRSGDTPDDFIADLAVGAGAAMIKSGAPSRSERTAKYNRLLAIAQDVAEAA